jgi:hypothetical protein
MLGGCFGFLGFLWFWVLHVGFRVGSYGFLWVFLFYGLALAVPVYTPSVLRGALRFYIKFSYLSKKSR